MLFAWARSLPRPHAVLIVSAHRESAPVASALARLVRASLPTHDPARLLDLGARLRALREQGVLVIGSGFTTHGLPLLTRAAWTGLEVPTWSREFDARAAEAMARGDVDELAAFRERAPGVWPAARCRRPERYRSSREPAATRRTPTPRGATVPPCRARTRW